MTEKFLPFKSLAFLKNCLKRDDGSASFHRLKSLTLLRLHASIAMPDCKKLVKD